MEWQTYTQTVFVLWKLYASAIIYDHNKEFHCGVVKQNKISEE